MSAAIEPPDAFGPGLPPDIDPAEQPAEMGATVKRGVGYAGVGYAAAQALNLGFQVVLARLLTPADIGDFAAATALYVFATFVNEGGMMAAIIQRRDRIDEAASTATVSTFFGGILLSLAALAISPLIGSFFKDSQVTTIAAASSGLIFLRTVAVVPEALLQRRFSFLRRLIIDPAQVVVFGVVAVTCAASGLGVWSLVIGYYSGAVADVVLSWALIRWRPKLHLVSFSMWRELVAYGRHLLLATTVQKAGDQADAIIVGRLLGPAPLGQFRYAFRLASAPFGGLLSAASYVLFPAFARIADDTERFRDGYLRSLRWMCVIAFPAGMIFLPLGEPIAVTLFGERWRSAGYALMGLCFFAGGAAVNSIVSEGLKGIGRPQALTGISAVTTISAIVAMVALQPLGLPAVAAGFSLGTMVGAGYAIRVAGRVLHVDPLAQLKETWAPIVASVFMAGAVLPLELLVVNADGHPTAIALLLLAAEGLLAAVLYLAALSLLAPSLRHPLVSGGRSALAAAVRFLKRERSAGEEMSTTRPAEE
jgi:O-antigen/teichoic acid export membrane protein